MNDSKIVQAGYVLAITTFFNFFIFQILFYNNLAQLTITTICAAVAAISIIVSIFYTKGSISVGLMLNAIIMSLYIAFLYWDIFTGSYKFFIALGLLVILIYSLYKVIKK